MKRILSVFLIFALLVSVTACGDSSEDTVSENSSYSNSVKTAVGEALTALKNFDQEGIERYFEGDYFSEQTLEATGVEKAKAIFSSFSWKLNNTSVDGDDIYLALDITTVSLVDAMETIKAEINKSDEFIEDLDGYALTRLKEMATDPETEKVTLSTEFILRRVNDSWVITNGDILLTIFSIRAGDTVEE